MRVASSRLSIDAQVCMDAQSDVKQFVKQQYMRGVSWLSMQKKLDELIKSYEKELTAPQLREQFKKSLLAMAMRVYTMLETSPAFGSLAVLSAVLLLNSNKGTNAERNQAQAVIMRATPTLFTRVDTEYWKAPKYYGTQVQLRVASYMKNVKETLQRLAKERAIDIDDDRTVKERNSLRATAEMIVRQNAHDKEIADLQEKGVKLVVCSTHADCSDRCFKWQGRVYSLDGSSGVTDDGRQYVPLSEATDVYVTTKAGRVYKNGLLGFNCRHRLVEYVNGRKPPMVTKKEQQREKKIDERQRAYERQVVQWREQAIAYKGIDEKRYQQAKANADKIMHEYIAYSHNNGRSYYESRVRIL